VLLAADGMPDAQIARTVGVSPGGDWLAGAVAAWRDCCAGVRTAPGRPATPGIGTEIPLKVLKKTVATRPLRHLYVGKELPVVIGRFGDAHKDRIQPFGWTKDTDELLANI
jgi:hypothetical protein